MKPTAMPTTREPCDSVRMTGSAMASSPRPPRWRAGEDAESWSGISPNTGRSCQWIESIDGDGWFGRSINSQKLADGSGCGCAILS